MDVTYCGSAFHSSSMRRSICHVGDLDELTAMSLGMYEPDRSWLQWTTLNITCHSHAEGLTQVDLLWFKSIVCMEWTEVRGIHVCNDNGSSLGYIYICDRLD